MNLAVLTGFLAEEPELSYTPSSMAILKLRLTVKEQYKTKQGEQKERMNWFTLKVFGPRAEAFNNELGKGSEIIVRGRISNESYERDGVKKYWTEIICDEVTCVSRPRDNAPTDKPAEQASFSADDIPF